MKGVLTLFLICISSSFALDWWEGGNFYQIYPRSFMDSNADGVGDLKGIQSKVTYLKSLGVDGVWLSPIFKSPMADFGYDISDFRDIHGEFGTMEDFDNMLAEFKRQGVKLILDFVPNHSSDEHEWFIKSENRTAGYEDYFVWDDGKIDPNTNVLGPPSNWLSAFRYSAWRWSDIRQQMYLHQFHYKQPDLNYRNSKVVQEMKDILTFWMTKGVAGFRIDAVPVLFEKNNNGTWPDEPRTYQTGCDENDRCFLQHIYIEDQPETYEMSYQWKATLDQFKLNNGGDTILMMVESYASTDLNMKYFGNATVPGGQVPFNFELIKEINAAKVFTASRVKTITEEWITKTPAGQHPNWVVGNHDQHRIASKVGVAKIDLINIMIQTLPGIAITYQGEELGMEDVHLTWAETVDPPACNGAEEGYDERSRDPARTPFPWDNTTNAGFTTGSSTWLPVGTAYTTVNVKAQQEASNSHLKIFKSLVMLRKHPVLREGSYLGIVSGNVYAYKREVANSSVAVVLLNFGNSSVTLNVKSLFSTIPNQMVVHTSSLDSGFAANSTMNVTSITIKGSVGMILLHTSTSSSPGTASSHFTVSFLLLFVTCAFMFLNLKKY